MRDEYHEYEDCLLVEEHERYPERFRTMKSLVEKAEHIARIAHSGQMRRDGVTPYILHPERVVARLRAQGVTDEETLAVAWLHDVMEDCGYTAGELRREGITNECVIYCVKLLSKEHDSRSYELYIGEIAQREVARTVKIADILDNLSDTPTERQILRYSKALIHLLQQ